MRKMLSFLLALCLIVAMIPVGASAENDIAEITIGETTTKYQDTSAFEAAIEGMTSDTVASVKMLANITVSGSNDASKILVFPKGTTTTLDLNGFTLTVGMRVNSTGTLTVTDSSESKIGKIVSQSTNSIYILSGGNFTLEGGTLESKTPIYTAGSSDTHITILGGTVRSTATSRSTFYVAIDAQSASSLVIGSGDSEKDNRIVIDGGATYGVYLPEGDQESVQFKGGWVSSLCGTLRDPDEMHCKLGEPIDDILPAGKVSKVYTDESTQETYYQIVDLTEEADVAATIGVDRYASIKSAVIHLQTSETLTLQKDVTLNEQLRITAADATLDLNGYDYTNTYSYGVYAYLSNGPIAGSTFRLKNSGNHTSTVTAKYQPVYLYGPFKGMATLYIEGDIALHRDSGDLVKLANAQMAYSESAAAMIGNGGFKATESDGQSYIYGGYDEAAEADINHTAVLLNDYRGLENLTVPAAKSYVVDLNGHTYTVTSTINGAAAIDLSKAKASLTVKNGNFISLMADGAFLNEDNASLSLENVNLSVPNNTYGIVAQGTHSGISVNLTGGSVSAKSDGVGIYFPSDDSTLVIDGTTITGDTAVAVKGGTTTIRGNSVLHGSGAARIPDAAQGSGTNRTGAAIYLEGNYSWNTAINIEGGYFISDQADAVQMLFANEDYTKAISISGGYFTSDPSEYVVAGKAALPSDQAGYAFMVGPKPENVVEGIEPASGDPVVDDSKLPSDMDDEAKQAAAEAASSVQDGGELAAAANSVLDKVSEAQVEAATNAINDEDSGVTVGGAEVKVYVQTYLDIKPTEYTAAAEGSTATLTLDITPMYRVVASTAASADQIRVVGEVGEGGGDPNAVVLEGSESNKGLNITTMTLSVTLPDVFKNQTVYIQHKDYEYTAKADNDTVTFTNPHGFSEFTFTTASQAEAQIGDTIYTSLQAAVDNVKTGETITLLKDGLKATVSREVSFTIANENSNDFKATLTAGSGYTMTKGTNGQYTFTKESSTPITPGPGGDDNDEDEFPFVDVKSSAWYYEAVKYVYENSLMAGTSDTTFDPETKLTRAMAAQILYNLDGQPTVSGDAAFTDMNAAPTWSFTAIAWAQETGVVAGMGDGTFAPNDNVTREQFAQMMYNYAKYKEYDMTKTGDLSKFPDDESVSGWAETALSWANGNGLINGHDDGTLAPQGNTIRGQAASILMNFDLNLAK